MNQNDRQKERMRVWARVYAAAMRSPTKCDAYERARGAVFYFDEHFPQPAPTPGAVTILDAIRSAKVKMQTNPDGPGTEDEAIVPVSEYFALQKKAELWDAVASGRVSIFKHDGRESAQWSCSWEGSGLYTGRRYFPTLAEAVEAAIAAGARP